MILEVILILIKIFLITWFITNDDIIQDKINDLFEKINSKKLIIDYIHIIVGCHKCLSLWTTLIITQNVWYALTVSFISYLLKRN